MSNPCAKPEQDSATTTFVDIVTATTCNLHCDYCSQGDKIQHPIEYDIDLLIDFIASLNKPVCAVFYGGEPLVNQSYVEILTERFSGMCKIGVQTNGTLFEKYNESFLRSLDLIMISMDGDGAINDRHRGAGTYDRILGNISTLKHLGKKVYARMTAHEEMEFPGNSIRHLIDICDGVYWQIADSDYEDPHKFIHQYNGSIELLVDFWIDNLKDGQILSIAPFCILMHDILSNKQYPVSRCGAGTTRHFYVTPNGSLSVCADRMYDDTFSLGNIATGLSPYTNKTHRSSERCIRCDVSDLCAGSCLTDVVENRDDAYRLVKCETIKSTINALLAQRDPVSDMIDRGLFNVDELICGHSLFYQYCEVIP